MNNDAPRFPYVNNTNADLRFAHAAIIEAIANGGALPEELADLFTLTKCPAGSAAGYRIDWL